MLCKDKYVDHDEIDTGLLDQYRLTATHMTEWYCPVVDSFSLLNRLTTYEIGRSFKLVIDYCDEREDSCVND